MDAFSLERFVHAAIYGRVVLARRRSTGALVAIKAMSRAHMAARRAVAGPRVQEDGLAELETLRLLSMADADADAAGGRGDRRFVLTLLEDFVDWRTDSHCLVFDYCARGELFSRLERDGALPPADARRCFSQVARALRFVHSRGVAHRDLSLENVLVDAAGRCRVADFGLASATGDTCVGRVGKPFYMAPEVLHSSPSDAYDGLAADMWSLGVLLFIMATGVPPFERASDADPRFRVVRAKGVRALLETWRFQDKLPAPAQQLLGRLLVVDPAQRATICQVCEDPWVAHADVSDASESPASSPSAAEVAEMDAAGSCAADWEPQEELDAEDASLADTAKDPALGTAAEAGARSREPPRSRKRIKIVVAPCKVDAPVTVKAQSAVDEVSTQSIGADESIASPCVASGSAERMIPSDPRASPAVWPARSKAAAAPRCLDFSSEPARVDASDDKADARSERA